MSEKQSRKLRELEYRLGVVEGVREVEKFQDIKMRLGVVEKFMVRVLQLVNDKHDPGAAKVGADISEYSDDVEDFDEA